MEKTNLDLVVMSLTEGMFDAESFIELLDNIVEHYSLAFIAAQMAEGDGGCCAPVNAADAYNEMLSLGMVVSTLKRKA